MEAGPNTCFSLRTVRALIICSALLSGGGGRDTPAPGSPPGCTPPAGRRGDRVLAAPASGHAEQRRAWTWAGLACAVPLANCVNAVASGNADRSPLRPRPASLRRQLLQGKQMARHWLTGRATSMRTGWGLSAGTSGTKLKGVMPGTASRGAFTTGGVGAKCAATDAERRYLPYPGAEMNARDVVELVYRTLSERGPDAVAEFVDPEATLVAADGGRIEGREKVLDHLRRERAAFSNLVTDVRVVAADGPIVVLEGVMRGKHDRELTLPSGHTLPATGREINLELLVVAQVANDRVTQVRRYLDRLTLMAQLGVLPPVPGAE